MKKKWIALDRDGVINYDSDDYIKTPDEWIPIPGSLEAIARLNWAGYYVVIVSNQSGIGRGLYTEETLTEIHKKMQDALIDVGGHVEAIFYCPHKPDENCSCRKPKIGLLQSLARECKTKLENLIVIGDKLSDIQAARTAGCKPILVRSGRGEQTLTEHGKHPDLVNVPVFIDLADAVNALLKQEKIK